MDYPRITFKSTEQIDQFLETKRLDWMVRGIITNQVQRMQGINTGNISLNYSPDDSDSSWMSTATFEFNYGAHRTGYNHICRIIDDAPGLYRVSFSAYRAKADEEIEYEKVTPGFIVSDYLNQALEKMYIGLTHFKKMMEIDEREGLTL